MPLSRLIVLLSLVLAPFAAQAADKPHNVLLFVADGLRAESVTVETAPTMAALRDRGVNFKNSHSLYPTVTMLNASGLSTGHFMGDTGTINTLYTGKPIASAHNSITPGIENDAVLGEMDQQFGGNFMNEETILAAARRLGLSTAAIGKRGPTLLFDHTQRDGATIIMDDATGTKDGIPLSQEMKDRLAAVGLPDNAVLRGDNGKSGDFQTPGTLSANVAQQAYLADVATKAVLPLFRERGKPFVLVFWSRDPDATQHNQGDSLNQLTPGINGPTALAGIKNADNNLAQLQQALKDLGLAETTDIIVVADHGFSTISKQSETSTTVKVTYEDVPKQLMPPGFLAIDLSKALGLPLYDTGNLAAPVAGNAHPKSGAQLGADPKNPDVVLAVNGGSDLIYLPNKDAKLASRIVEALFAQDYVSGVFVDDDLGPIPGTLPLSAINWRGRARVPLPSMIVNFRSFSTGCDEPLLCAVEINDTDLQQGQGSHGTLSRADTMNFMAAAGPGFKTGFIDEAPVSNADIGRTIAAMMKLDIVPKGKLLGRVITEAQPGGVTPKVTSKIEESQPASNGLKTVLMVQEAEGERYFDAAGFPGRTVGLKAPQPVN